MPTEEPMINSKSALFFNPACPPPPPHLLLLQSMTSSSYLSTGGIQKWKTVAESKHAELENHFSQNKDRSLSCVGSRARSSVSTKISKTTARFSSAKKMFWSAEGGWWRERDLFIQAQTIFGARVREHREIK